MFSFQLSGESRGLILWFLICEALVSFCSVSAECEQVADGSRKTDTQEMINLGSYSHQLYLQSQQTQSKSRSQTTHQISFIHTAPEKQLPHELPVTLLFSHTQFLSLLMVF